MIPLGVLILIAVAVAAVADMHRTERRTRERAAVCRACERENERAA